MSIFMQDRAPDGKRPTAIALYVIDLSAMPSSQYHHEPDSSKIYKTHGSLQLSNLIQRVSRRSSRAIPRRVGSAFMHPEPKRALGVLSTIRAELIAGTISTMDIFRCNPPLDRVLMRLGDPA
ncbi:MULTISPECIES: hypothetical protein [Rhodopseudomonas]|uniref:hypothetical protein n=1 Tax=Rhodopseudomonas TaxID=1073 RepID=UPI00128E08B6|nr:MULTISPECIES: hypothetical protein [Rhodopseudomonas]MDF3809895.1 hypothetical protein [Rhodopseudomonas sp. BAL398]WOK17932.1 hypothetical protein RBJ75_28140 [Rhodopseudomonas sp. BAL398]